MPELESDAPLKPDALATLKIIGLRGGVDSEVKVSCSDLADEMDTSDQTISRRLQSLESSGAVQRETVSDGQWITVTEEGEHVLRHEYEEYKQIFDRDRTVTLEGKVVSGMGEGEYYISLDGYMRQFRNKLGYEPYPGTLNLELHPESSRKRSALKSAEGILIEEWENEERTFGAATCYPADIQGVEGHVIYPHRTHYPDEMLELIAPVKLIDELSLEDGDTLEVEVNLE